MLTDSPTCSSVSPRERRERDKNKYRLYKYTGNVKIIFGAEDRYLNKKVAQKFHGIFPASSLHLIDKAAHFVPLDNPNKVAEQILEPFIPTQNPGPNDIESSGSL